jgi:hypothetical protein
MAHIFSECLSPVLAVANKIVWQGHVLNAAEVLEADELQQDIATDNAHYAFWKHAERQGTVRHNILVSLIQAELNSICPLNEIAQHGADSVLIIRHVLTGHPNSLDLTEDANASCGRLKSFPWKAMQFHFAYKAYSLAALLHQAQEIRNQLLIDFRTAAHESQVISAVDKCEDLVEYSMNTFSVDRNRRRNGARR